MSTNKRDQKFYIRFDGSGRAIAGSGIWRQSKPKQGNWVRMPGYECCDDIVICSTTTSTSSTTTTTTTTP